MKKILIKIYEKINYILDCRLSIAWTPRKNNDQK